MGNGKRHGRARCAGVRLVARSVRAGWGKVAPKPIEPHRGDRGGRRLEDKPEKEKELEALRRTVNRGTPFGDSFCTRRIAGRLDLQFTLRPVGRPRSTGKN